MSGLANSFSLYFCRDVKIEHGDHEKYFICVGVSYVGSHCNATCCALSSADSKSTAGVSVTTVYRSDQQVLCSTTKTATVFSEY